MPRSWTARQGEGRRGEGFADDRGIFLSYPCEREGAAAAQALTALLIRRFREMDMPLGQIRVVLAAAHPASGTG